MRWCRFDTGGSPRYGLVEGDIIREVAGDPFDGYDITGSVHNLEAVHLLVPVEPRTFYCVGLNYAKHIREAADRNGTVPNLPTQPDVGYRANNALIGHGADIVIPQDAKKVHYEGEVVAVIGKTTRKVSEAEALDHVLGFTIGNDVSERLWQKSDRTLWRAKNSDTFKPMGPWIDTEARLEDMYTTVRVNGEQTIRFKTDEMIFGVARFISVMSQYMTLWPGDVIWMGTDGTSPDLKPGDVVEIDITGIGTLKNQLVAEA
ncbi:fumarylacetoacetate hydrolase family protein [Pseudooceanicola sp.]|uniref:fumarylacetoacetate hydrolase family protein n=1 Tax=Pseudooceanicola sp. TaxID=1914328 RepID=UPI0026306513|nr:fumarylacetoacetate hydrolase family protein [Pseudooceanicola sp.]MDF1856737.1 fumarylacetoacetate hydrolase family protein [Pseudooceanicola sp.]